MKTAGSFWKSNPVYYFLLAFLAVATAVLIYTNVTTHVWVRWDEQTNVQVVREFVANPGFVLTLNGQPFFEKPPLWYYLTGKMSVLMGVNFLSTRLVSIISIAGIILTAWYLSRLWQRRGFLLLFWLALLNMPMLWWQNYGTFNTHTLWSTDLDALHYMLSFAGCAAVATWLKKPTLKVSLVATLFFALSFLTKGIFALALYLVFTLLLFKRNAFKQLGCSLALFLALILPWHLLMGFTYGNSFWDTYLGYHLAGRIFTVLEEHAGSFSYYLQLFFSWQLNPFWPLLLISGFLAVTRRHRNSMLAHLMLPLLLLLITLVQTKLTWYIFPVLFLECCCLASLAWTWKIRSLDKG